MSSKKLVLNQESLSGVINPNKETLQFMLDLLYLRVNGIRHLPYHEQANLVNFEFNSNVKEEDIANVYEPSLIEDIIDIEHHYPKN